MSKLAACLAALIACAAPALAQVWAQGRQRIVSPAIDPVVFGRAVAALDLDGDGDLDLAIADPSTTKGEDPPSPEVHFFFRTPNGWQAPTSALIDVADFGAVLAVGDFDEDGRDDLLIGAPGATGGGGAVYRARLTESDGVVFGSVLTTANAAGGGCGSSLAVGDFDGDDHLDFAAGCPRASFDAFTSAGRVAVVYGDGEGGFAAPVYFHQASSGVAGGPEEGDLFGASLAAGDFVCDGIDDLAIGVPGEDVDSATDTGALHVLPGVAETGLTGTGSQLWHQGSTDVPGLSENGDSFAESLAAGDFDRGLFGPYCDDLAIGVPKDVGSPGGGLVVLFGTHEGLSSAGAMHLAFPSFPQLSGPQAGHRLATTLAAGRVDGDFDDDLIVGFEGVAGGPTPLAPEAGALAGLACVLYGDADLTFAFGTICFDGGSAEFVDPLSNDADPYFGLALAVGPSDAPSGAGIVIGSRGRREAFVLDTALFADGFELERERWSFDTDD